MYSVNDRIDKLEGLINLKKPLNKKERELALQLTSDIRLIANMFKQSHLNLEQLQSIISVGPAYLVEGLWTDSTGLPVYTTNTFTPKLKYKGTEALRRSSKKTKNRASTKNK